MKLIMCINFSLLMRHMKTELSAEVKIEIMCAKNRKERYYVSHWEDMAMHLCNHCKSFSSKRGLNLHINENVEEQAIFTKEI